MNCRSMHSPKATHAAKIEVFFLWATVSECDWFQPFSLNTCHMQQNKWRRRLFEILHCAAASCLNMCSLRSAAPTPTFSTKRSFGVFNSWGGEQEWDAGETWLFNRMHRSMQWGDASFLAQCRGTWGDYPIHSPPPTKPSCLPDHIKDYMALQEHI